VMSSEAPPGTVDRGARDLRVLKTIAEALNGASNVNEALEATLRHVATLLGLDAGWIWLTDPRSGRFYGAAAQRLPPFLREPVRMAGQSCWCLKAFKAGELRAGNIDVMECSRLRGAVAERDRARTRGLRYHASVPLYFGDRPLGIMNVAAPAWRKLTRRELDLLSTIASQVGVAVERARLAGESVHLARMEERTRLAREIHDTLAQGLTAIGLQIEDALARLTPDADAAQPLQRAMDLSRAALDDARDSIRQLRSAGAPPLAERLKATAHAFAAETGVRVHVDAKGPAALASAQEDEVMRIVTEALSNIRKHARATDVTVSVRAERRRLRLEIRDNGRGFVPSSRSGGFGVIGMRERARALGGRLMVSTRAESSRSRHASGSGTRILLTVPIGDSKP
jgi:two-component system, NarL family, sensor kinase